MSSYMDVPPAFQGRQLRSLQLEDLENSGPEKHFTDVLSPFIEVNYNKNILAVGSANKILFLKLNRNAEGEQKFEIIQTVDATTKDIGAAWNERYQKLISWDVCGTYAIWMQSDIKKEWHAPRRHKAPSRVRTIRWSPDNSKTAILTMDGFLFTTDLYGERIWGRELENSEPTCCEWTSNDEIIVGLAGGIVTVYNKEGQQLLGLGLNCYEDQIRRSGPSDVAKIQHWHPILKEQITLGSSKPLHIINRPQLAIIYKNGAIRLSKNLQDLEPFTLTCNITPFLARWSPDGSCIVIIGLNEVSENTEVIFLSAFGNILGVYVAGVLDDFFLNSIRAFAWDFSGEMIYFGVLYRLFVGRLTAGFEADQEHHGNPNEKTTLVARVETDGLLGTQGNRRL